MIVKDKITSQLYEVIVDDGGIALMTSTTPIGTFLPIIKADDDTYWEFIVESGTIAVKESSSVTETINFVRDRITSQLWQFKVADGQFYLLASTQVGYTRILEIKVDNYNEILVDDIVEDGIKFTIGDDVTKVVETFEYYDIKLTADELYKQNVVIEGLKL